MRQEAVEKMKDPAMLAQIALEEKNPEIRETAEARLAELNNLELIILCNLRALFTA